MGKIKVTQIPYLVQVYLISQMNVLGAQPNNCFVSRSNWYKKLHVAGVNLL